MYMYINIYIYINAYKVLACREGTGYVSRVREDKRRLCFSYGAGSVPRVLPLLNLRPDPTGPTVATSLC